MRYFLKFCCVLALCVPFLVKAQQSGASVKDEVNTLRRNVYTRVLSLSDAESKKFWPMFDKMQAELDALRAEAMKQRRNVAQNYASMSDAEMEKAINSMLDLEQKELDVKKKYYKEFRSAIPVKKIALLPKAEREFKKELLLKIKTNKDTEE
jgi:hypothetical protein